MNVQVTVLWHSLSAQLGSVRRHHRDRRSLGSRLISPSARGDPFQGISCDVGPHSRRVRVSVCVRAGGTVRARALSCRQSVTVAGPDPLPRPSLPSLCLCRSVPPLACLSGSLSLSLSLAPSLARISQPISSGTLAGLCCHQCGRLSPFSQLLS